MERVSDTKKFTLKEAAKAAGVCARTLYHYRDRGIIRFSSYVATKKPYILGKELNKLDR